MSLLYYSEDKWLAGAFKINYRFLKKTARVKKSSHLKCETPFCLY